MLKVAIVSTISDCKTLINFFIRYHFSIGFSQIFLFFDDPNEALEVRLEDYKGVHAFGRSSELEALWRSTSYYYRVKDKKLINNEVMIRQALNAEVAIELAKKMQIDWLIHIDIDELFYCQEDSILSHFEEKTKKGTTNIVYPNLEAMPTEENCKNPFVDIVFFKKNFFSNNRWGFTEIQKEYLDTSTNFDDKFFLFYQNGKSAVYIKETLGAKGVHYFYARGIKESNSSEFPVVLHFPCANFELFKLKYSRLGNFSDEWNNKPRVGKFVSTFHIEARDHFAKSYGCHSMEFYKERVVVPQEVIDELLELDMAIEIRDVKDKPLTYLRNQKKIS